MSERAKKIVQEIQALMDASLDARRWTSCVKYIDSLFPANPPTGMTPAAEIAWLRDRLKEAQATIAQQEAQGAEMRTNIEAHKKWHEDYDEHDGWPESELNEKTYKALSLHLGQQTLERIKELEEDNTRVKQNHHLAAEYITALESRNASLVSVLHKHDKWHFDNDEYDGYEESDLYEITHAVLTGDDKPLVPVGEVKTIYEMTLPELKQQWKRQRNYLNEVKRLIRKRRQGFLPPELEKKGPKQ